MPFNLDLAAGNLLGYDPNQFRGLLDPVDIAKARQQAILGTGLGLLNAGGRSTQPVNFGQAFAQAAMMGQQQGQQSLQQAMMMRQMAAQRAAAQRPQYQNVPGVGLVAIPPDGEPSVAIPSAPGMSNAPSSVEEYQFWLSLPPAERENFLKLKRAEQQQVKDVGGVPTILSPGQAPRPLSSLDKEAEAAAAKAAAAAAGAKRGEAAGQAQIDLPKIQTDANQVLSLIREIRNHPGTSMAVGGTSYVPAPRGSPANDATVLIDQLKGQQFLQAYSRLKGAGTITEVEGRKAEAAIARMDRSQSDEAFMKALDEFESVVSAALADAEKKSKGAASGGATGRYNPATGKIEKL
jgi:hypothetical protein